MGRKHDGYFARMSSDHEMSCDLDAGDVWHRLIAQWQRFRLNCADAHSLMRDWARITMARVCEGSALKTFTTVKIEEQQEGGSRT